MKQPPWYTALEAQLEPHWDLMLLIAAVLIGITVVAVWSGDPVWLAFWLVYLMLP